MRSFHEFLATSSLSDNTIFLNTKYNGPNDSRHSLEFKLLEILHESNFNSLELEAINLS